MALFTAKLIKFSITLKTVLHEIAFVVIHWGGKQNILSDGIMNRAQKPLFYDFQYLIPSIKLSGDFYSVSARFLAGS
jgi:hypothetical protein